MRRLLILIFILLSWVGQASASHLTGGQITWVCLGNGQYQFYLSLYRDCASSVAIDPPSILVWNHPTISSIAVTLFSQTEISPNCNAAGPAINCLTVTPTTIGAVEEFVYRSDPITLAGVPPAEGWIFTYDNCCRNQLVNIVNAQNEGFTLRAKMFSYDGRDMSPCYDSSPQFAEVPATILCSGSPYVYNNNAYDNDLDSLSYKWGEALDDITSGVYQEGVNPPPLPYAFPYTSTNPIPNGVVDPITGELTFSSGSTGNFVITVKVEGYKCGVLVAEIYRELQVAISNCSYVNDPPAFQNNNYSTTVTAGDVVNFNVVIDDDDQLSTGGQQTMTVTASGVQFGSNFSNPAAGCLNPPCATLNPPPIITGQNQVSTDFTWQTDCEHLARNCLDEDASNTYTFVIRVQDDACPIPAIVYKTLTVTIEGLETVGPPSLRCVSVLSNGDAQLTWVPAIDTVGTFNNYQIYHATDPSGPFTVIDSISNVNATTYTHAGAGADTGPHYYYMLTKSGCFGQAISSPTETLSSIFLTVDAPVSGGVAELSWTPLATPLPSTSSGWYRIMKEYPAGTWTLLDSTQGLTYDDEIVQCEAQINYRIDIKDNSGCVSSSNIDGDVFEDVTAPPPVEIDTVSVELVNNELATISWIPSTSGDVVEYVIYGNVVGNPSAWIPVGTVAAPGTFFMYGSSLASQQLERYRVAARDSCDNLGIYGGIHNTIYQTSVVDVCERATTITWNSYIGWASGVGQYDIYASEDGGAYQLVGTASASQTSYVHKNDKQYATYCYIVRAVSADGTKTSSSNKQCIFTDIPKPPDFSYINLVTVPEDGGVEVNCYVDTSADIKYYEVYRSDDSLDYALIDTTPFTGNTVISYWDEKAKSSEKSYFYKVVAIDSCGAAVDTTEHSKTILLVAEGKADRKNYLSWNAYQGFLGDVDAYNIYRSIDGVFDISPLATVGDGTLSYIDDVADVLEGDGEFCYYIEAVEGAGNPYGFTELSSSNRACAYQLPNFFVPNSFAPEGFNQVFIPVTVYVSKTGYIFQVFNRWGQKIFRTNDLKEGWSGYLDGLLLPQGVYVYYFQYLSAKGDVYEKRGTVTLIK